MKLAIEQAGLKSTGWISSCWSCLSWPSRYSVSSNIKDRQGRVCLTNGPLALSDPNLSLSSVREPTELCYDQPRPVSPMTLVSPNDHPTAHPSLPRGVRRESLSLSLHTLEDKVQALRMRKASRASSRMSTFSFKRNTSSRVTIGAPTDFRTLESFSQSQPREQLKPLELSIHRPESRLPDLPEFDTFQLEDNEQLPLRRPPRALSVVDDASRSSAYPYPNLYRLPRKPVGSAPRRSSLASAPERPLETRMSLDARSSLIPHFSIRISQAALFEHMPLPLPHQAPSTLDSDSTDAHYHPTKVAQYGDSVSAKVLSDPISTPLTADLPAGPLYPPMTPPGRRSSFSTYRSYPRSESSPTTLSSPRTLFSSPFSQWQFGMMGSRDWSLATARDSIDQPQYDRARTLSGSTLSPSLTNATESINNISPHSRRSTVTTTTVHSPFPDLHGEKAMELVDVYPQSLPFVSRREVPSISDEPVYPTIYEGQQQGDDGYGYDAPAWNRESPVGVAF